MKTTKKPKGISRIDQDERHTHGWYVRIQKDGRSVSKFFSDAMHGGKPKALAEAVSFREGLARKRELPKGMSVDVSSQPPAKRRTAKKSAASRATKKGPAKAKTPARAKASRGAAKRRG